MLGVTTPKQAYPRHSMDARLRGKPLRWGGADQNLTNKFANPITLITGTVDASADDP